MPDKYNILVTGCGGDIGQSIGKILKTQSLFNKVIGCDMNDENASRFIYDKVYKIPACTTSGYQPVLNEIIKNEEVDIVLPISEPELRFLAANKVQHTFLGKPLVCASLEAMEIGFDKYATALFLEDSNLPFPKTALINKLENPVYPMILKSRNGSGSKYLFVVENDIEYNFYKQKYPEFIMQEYLSKDSNEYTCGLFRSRKGEIRTIIYRRTLMGGFSGFGITEDNIQIENLLIEIAKKINLLGSINVQLKLTANGPCVFEINPRFSSTVMFRHLMGFEDVMWSIEDVLGIEISTYKKPIAGTKFYKGFNEYVN